MSESKMEVIMVGLLYIAIFLVNLSLCITIFNNLGLIIVFLPLIISVLFLDTITVIGMILFNLRKKEE